MSNKEEPKTAPQSDQWYNLSLGSSFNDDSSTKKYCTLRYEFKPASIDKSKPGSLHKNKENRVSVEFQNNQFGKPKVTFEGSSEDYKENDAVLFFDGHTFWLERLHRAVKQLRHLRKPDESASASAAASLTPDLKLSPPVGKGSKATHVARSTAVPLPVEVERIDIGEPQIPGPKVGNRGSTEHTHPVNLQNVSTFSPSPKKDEGEEHHEIDIDELFGSCSPADANAAEEKDVGFEDVKAQKQNDSDDDEIADVDDSDDETNKGRNAAETLKAQVNAEEMDDQTSSSSSSSGSGSSGSGSGSGSSNSSDSESDEDTVNSV